MGQSTPGRRGGRDERLRASRCQQARQALPGVEDTHGSSLVEHSQLTAETIGPVLSLDETAAHVTDSDNSRPSVRDSPRRKAPVNGSRTRGCRHLAPGADLHSVGYADRCTDREPTAAGSAVQGADAAAVGERVGRASLAAAPGCQQGSQSSGWFRTRATRDGEVDTAS